MAAKGAKHANDAKDWIKGGQRGENSQKVQAMCSKGMKCAKGGNNGAKGEK